MASKSPTPQELIRTIEHQAADVHRAATAMTERITAFEKWLAKLPGKVPAYYTEDFDIEGTQRECVAFRRAGGEWVIFYSVYDGDDHRDVVEPVLARDASIDIKARVITMLPELLNELREAQARFVNGAAAKVVAFDKFAAALGIKEGQ